MSKLRAFLRSCVATPSNVVLSAVTLLLIGWLLADLLSWAVIDAVWSGNSSRACDGHDAACWVFIRLRFEQLLYGPYPASERWRVAIVAMLCGARGRAHAHAHAQHGETPARRARRIDPAAVHCRTAARRRVRGI